MSFSSIPNLDILWEGLEKYTLDWSASCRSALRPCPPPVHLFGAVTAAVKSVLCMKPLTVFWKLLVFLSSNPTGFKVFRKPFQCFAKEFIEAAGSNMSGCDVWCLFDGILLEIVNLSGLRNPLIWQLEALRNSSLIGLDAFNYIGRIVVFIEAVLKLMLYCLRNYEAKIGENHKRSCRNFWFNSIETTVT